MNQWIDVNDRLPDADEIVLVVIPEANEPVWLAYRYEGDEDGHDVWLLPDGIPAGDVTHWMPLPELPTKG